MSRIISEPTNSNNNNPNPIKFPKQDKLRTFTPVILFHEHTYSVNASVECIRINQNDEHYSEFIRNIKKRVDVMLQENSRHWSLVSNNLRACERIYYGQEMFRPMISPSPTQLANTIYSHHPQDQLEGLAMKPTKRRRGNLPKATTALLKEWLAEHKKHPYPTEEEKLNLAKTTKLTLQQISNWFINARRRHLPHILDADFSSGKVSQSSPHELDIYPYEASDNSAEDSDNSGLIRRAPKCSARINKAGGIKKLNIRKRKTSSV